MCLDTCRDAGSGSEKLINENTPTSFDSVRLGRQTGRKTQEISGLIHIMKPCFFLIVIDVRHATCAVAIDHCTESSNTTVT